MGCKRCCAIIKIIFYLFFGLAIPIACIVMASKYDGQCPAQPLIEVYLYVAGAFCAIKGVLAIGTVVCLLCGNCNECGVCVPMVIDIILGVFLFAWFIAGSVWVYKLKDQYSKNPADPHYCNPSLYEFAFAVLTAQWVLNAVSMVISSVARCCGDNE